MKATLLIQAEKCVLHKKSRSIQGLHLNNLGSTESREPDATYKISRSSVSWFCSERVLKGFSIYWRGVHKNHVTSIV